MVNKEEIHIKVSDRFLRYSIAREEDFSNIEYKVLMNQLEHGLLECTKVICNGGIQLIYDISDYQPLSTFYTRLSVEDFFYIISELFTITEQVKNNGFMKNDHLELTMDKIFVNSSSKKVFMVYLPIVLNTEEKQESIETRINQILINIALNHFTLTDHRIKELYEDIKVRDFTLRAINTKIVNRDYGEADVLPMKQSNPDMAPRRIMTLTSINSPELIVLRVDKADYMIGKKVAPGHGLIRNFPTISREHGKITCQGDQFFITDLNSANGTYINEQRIPSYVACPLHSKDKLRLANLIFDIELS